MSGGPAFRGDPGSARRVPRRLSAPGRAVRAPRDAGFTLVELLVAVAVLAVLVSIVPRSFVFARSIIDSSRDWMGARLVAESVLNDELTGRSLQPGARGGVIDGRHWRATLRPLGVLGGSALDDGRTLLDVRVEVDVSAGRTLKIETMRMGGGAQ